MKKLVFILALIASPARGGEESSKAEWLQCHQQAMQQSYAIMYASREIRDHALFAYVVDLIECMYERGYGLDRNRCPSDSDLEFWCWRSFVR
jgi:hypothetical protein